MRRILFLSVQLLLLALILVFGVSIFHRMQSSGPESEIVYAGLAVPAKIETEKSEAPMAKLNDYSTIWKRNLFGASKETNRVLKDEPVDVKIALVKNGMDMELVGTLVSDNSDLNRAFLFNRNTGAIETYRQGNRLDRGRIKEILHAKVTIYTDNSNELLVFMIGDSLALSKTSSYAYMTSGNSAFLQQTSSQNLISYKSNSITLTKKEIVTSLAEIDKVENWFEISPFIKGKQPMGFRIGNIVPDSVFDKMGLRYGEAITAMNGKVITGPDQADEFFRILKEGGKVTIKLQKRRGVRRRARSIHLDIS